MKHFLLYLTCLSFLLLVSCASKTISEKPEYIKNIDTEEIEELLSYPLCIIMSSGVYCGDRNLGSLFVLTNKIMTGKDSNIRDILKNIKTNQFGTVVIQYLTQSSILAIPSSERIGDIFYKLSIRNAENKKGYYFIFGERAGKVYVPFSVINQIITASNPRF